MSATARKRKEEVAQALKKLIQAKGKMHAIKYQQLLDDLRGQSETVNTYIFFSFSLPLIFNYIFILISMIWPMLFDFLPGRDQGVIRWGAASPRWWGLPDGHRKDCATPHLRCHLTLCTIWFEMFSLCCKKNANNNACITETRLFGGSRFCGSSLFLPLCLKIKSS